MIDSHGWFDWMIRDPGPLTKTNGGINTVEMCIPHSAEGYWPHLQTLLHSEARRASWMFSNLQDGRCFQHYSIYAQVWGSGSGRPNNAGVMWENEGVAGEPFTQAQTDNCVRIIREVSDLRGWTPRRPNSATDLTATLYEHRECVRFGSEATACPSGRVPWTEIMGALKQEEDEMKVLRVWCKERGKTYLTDGVRAVEVMTTEDDKQFELLYGAHAAVLSGAQVDAMIAS